MNKFQVISGAVVLYCLATVAVACYISGAVWYVWLLAFGGNFIYDVFLALKKAEINQNSCDNELRRCEVTFENEIRLKPTQYEWKLWCSWVVWNCTSALGLTCVLLSVMGGALGSIVVISISASIIFLCKCRIKREQYRWWNGWIVTMWLFIIVGICKLATCLGFDVPVEVMLAICAAALFTFLLTLVAGFKYYVWPPLKVLADEISDIYRVIKRQS